MTGQSLPDTELDRLVVQGCADDYEDFDMIVSEVIKWTRSEFKAPEVNEIENALLESIAKADVIAYAYSETHQKFVATQADHQNIRTLWFYITEGCKARLDNQMKVAVEDDQHLNAGIIA
jgi:hypothetical protein